MSAGSRQAAWRTVEGKRSRHGWNRLEKSLAKTLNQMYTICKSDGNQSHIQSTEQYLKRVLMNFQELDEVAQTSDQDMLKHMDSQDSALSQAQECYLQQQQHLVPDTSTSSPRHGSSLSNSSWQTQLVGSPSTPTSAANASTAATGQRLNGSNCCSPLRGGAKGGSGSPESTGSSTTSSSNSCSAFRSNVCETAGSNALRALGSMGNSNSLMGSRSSSFGSMQAQQQHDVADSPIDGTQPQQQQQQEQSRPDEHGFESSQPLDQLPQQAQPQAPQHPEPPLLQQERQQSQQQQVLPTLSLTFKKKLDANARPFLPASMQKAAQGAAPGGCPSSDGQPPAAIQPGVAATPPAAAAAEEWTGDRPRACSTSTTPVTPTPSEAGTSSNSTVTTTSSSSGSANVGKGSDNNFKLLPRVATVAAVKGSANTAWDSASGTSPAMTAGAGKLQTVHDLEAKVGTPCSGTGQAGSSGILKCAATATSSSSSSTCADASSKAALQGASSQLQLTNRGKSCSNNSTSSSRSSVHSQQVAIGVGSKLQQVCSAAAAAVAAATPHAAAAAAGTDGACENGPGGTGSQTPAWKEAVDWVQVFEAPQGEPNRREKAAAKDSSVPARLLHEKLLSPDRMKKSPLETKQAVEAKQARAEQLRVALIEKKLARLAKAEAERQAARNNKEKEDQAEASAAKSSGKHERSRVLRDAHLRRIKAKAGDETRKVEEVTFINTLKDEERKAVLQQRLEEGEQRRAGQLAAIQAKSSSQAASIREAQQRKKQLEAKRLAQLADKQRRKQVAQAKLEEDRRAVAAARECSKREPRAVAQQVQEARQQEVAALYTRINGRLKEAGERRLKHLELIRDRAALGKDFDRRDSFNMGSRCNSPYTGKPMSPFVKAASPSPVYGSSFAPAKTAAAAAGVSGPQAAGLAAAVTGALGASHGAAQEGISRALAKSRRGLLPPQTSDNAAAAAGGAGGGAAVTLSPNGPRGTTSSSSGSRSVKDTCPTSKQPHLQQKEADIEPTTAAGQQSPMVAARTGAAAAAVAGLAPAVSRLQSERPASLQVPSKGRLHSAGRGVGTSTAGGSGSSSSPGADAGRGGLGSQVGWYGVGVPQNESNKLRAARRRAAKFAKKMEGCRATYQEPMELLQLLQTPAAEALASNWAPYLAVLNLRVLVTAEAGSAAGQVTASGSHVVGEDPLMDVINEGAEDFHTEDVSLKEGVGPAGVSKATTANPGEGDEKVLPEAKGSKPSTCGVGAVGKEQNQGSDTGGAGLMNGSKLRGKAAAVGTKQAGNTGSRDQVQEQQQQQEVVLTAEQRTAFKRLVAAAMEPTRRLTQQQQQQRAAAAAAARTLRPSQGTSTPTATGAHGSPKSLALRQLQQQERQERQRQQQQREEQKGRQQQELCCHLVRQVGLLRLVVKEVVTGGPEQNACLALLLLCLNQPASCSKLLCLGLSPAICKTCVQALDHCNGLYPEDEEGGAADTKRLNDLLQVLVCILEHKPSDPALVTTQEHLVGYCVAAGMINRVRDVFSLFDQPTIDPTRPVPPYVQQCLRLLSAMTAARQLPRGDSSSSTSSRMDQQDSICVDTSRSSSNTDGCRGGNGGSTGVQGGAAGQQLVKSTLLSGGSTLDLVVALQETATAGLLSLLTAVLLHAAPTCTPAEASPGALPSNFVETAHLVLCVLNNVAQLDLSAAQQLLSATHSRVEFFHLIGFLLSYCTHQWPGGTSTMPLASAASTVAVASSRTQSSAAAATAGAAVQISGSRSPSPDEGCTDGLNRGSIAVRATVSSGAAGGITRTTATAAAAVSSLPTCKHSPPVGADQPMSSGMKTGGAPKVAGDGASGDAGLRHDSSGGKPGTRPTSSTSKAGGSNVASKAAAGATDRGKAQASTGSSKNSSSSTTAASKAVVRSSGAEADKPGPVQGGIAAAVAVVAHHPIAELLNQVILLLGYFCLRNPSNQGMLQWGKSPTLLQRLCSVPFPYFSHPELVDVYMPTLLAVCYNHERACEMVEQYVSMDVLLQYARSQQEKWELGGVQSGAEQVPKQQGGVISSSRRATGSNSSSDGPPAADLDGVAAASGAGEILEGEVEGVGVGDVGSKKESSSTVTSSSSGAATNAAIWQLGGHLPPVLSKLLLRVNHNASCLQAGTTSSKSSSTHISSSTGISQSQCSSGSGPSGVQKEGLEGHDSGHMPGFASRFPLQLLPDVVTFLEGNRKCGQARVV